MKPKDFAFKPYKAPIEKISSFWVILSLIVGPIAVIACRISLFYIIGFPDNIEVIIFYIVADLGAIFSMFYSVLNGKGLKIALVFGLLHDVFLGINAYKQGIFGSFIYYFFISFPLLLSGLIRWNRNSTNTARVSSFSDKSYVCFAIIFVVAYGALCGFLNLPFMNARLIYLDSLIIVLNSFSTFFASKRSFLQWPTNIIVNILCLVEYSIMASYNITNISLVIATVIYTINAVINFFLWRYNMKKHDIYCREFYQN